MVTDVRQARYAIALWDFEQGGRWSYALAAETLGRVPHGLTWREVGAAIRKLCDVGYEPDTSIYVSREIPIKDQEHGRDH